MAGTITIGSLGSSIDTLAAQYQNSLKTQLLVPLQSRQSNINAQITTLAAMKAKLKALYDAAGNLTLSSSARADAIRSSRFNDATDTIVTSEMNSAEQTAGTAARQFRLSVGSNLFTIDVALGSGDTNSTVLNSIADAVNNNASASSYVTASVVAAAPGQSKLVFTSKITGSLGAVSLQDVTGSTLLSNLGLKGAVVSGRSAPSLSTIADDPLHAPGGYDFFGTATVLNASQSSPYAPIVGQSTDSSVAGAAGPGSTTGSHVVRVTQLAKNDTIIVKQFTSSDTSIADAFSVEGYGTKTFAITNGSGSAVPISVALAEGDTNSQALTKIAAAINGTQGAGVNASVVMDDSTHSRLVLTSKSMGASNAITAITDSTGTLANVLGLSAMSFSAAARTASSTGQTGFLQTDSGELNSKFKLDGLDIVRSTNVVSDVLTGVTLTLQGISQSDVTITLSTDNTQIQANIQKFLDAYNAAMSYVKAQTAVDTTTFTKQILASDSTFVNLRSSLQTDVLRQVSGLGSAPSLLSAIGITSDKQGVLGISDLVKFNSAITGDTSKIAQLFNSSDGLAVRLKNHLEGFVSSGGRVDSSTVNLNSTLATLKSQITRKTDQITKQVQRYRDQYAVLQGALQTATAQQTQLNSLYSALGLV
jgi:flagellar hook-associated protein 2